MPGMDGTGPWHDGPGGGRGPCDRNPDTREQSSATDAPARRNAGRGPRGAGIGRPRCGRGFGLAKRGFGAAQTGPSAQDNEGLKAQLAAAQDEIAAMKVTLEELQRRG